MRDHPADIILLMLDFDGTISPIAPTPEEAVILPEAKRALLELRDNPHFTVCIISGRSLDDLKRKVGMKGIIYVGNHGLETEGLHLTVPGLDVGSTREKMNEIFNELKEELSEVAGMVIEDKGLSVSVHYRKVDPELVAQIQDATRRVAGSKKGVVLNPGKMVLEIRPDILWDKGRMARWLMHEVSKREEGRTTLPIFIGDDLTDEDAFHELERDGMTILVSDDDQRRTIAQYTLDSPHEVALFLETLEEAIRCDSIRCL